MGISMEGWTTASGAVDAYAQELGYASGYDFAQTLMGAQNYSSPILDMMT
jgi:hypothetical protein